jgi:hypothetical protein
MHIHGMRRSSARRSASCVATNSLNLLFAPVWNGDETPMLSAAQNQTAEDWDGHGTRFTPIMALMHSRADLVPTTCPHFLYSYLRFRSMAPANAAPSCAQLAGFVCHPDPSSKPYVGTGKSHFKWIRYFRYIHIRLGDISTDILVTSMWSFGANMPMNNHGLRLCRGRCVKR